MRAYLTTIIEGGTESFDLEIVEAASGFEALKTLPHHKFDAILTESTCRTSTAWSWCRS